MVEWDNCPDRFDSYFSSGDIVGSIPTFCSNVVPLRLIKEVKTPITYCRPCEAFTSDNDAMIEVGSEFPVGGHLRKCERKSIQLGATKPEIGQ